MSKPRASSGLGKVILLGEHAVVSGHPALAAAIDRRVSIDSSPGHRGLHLVVPAWDLDVRGEDDHPVASALRAMATRAQADDLDLEMHADAEVPKAAGLGSSAALCVAVSRSLLAASGQSRSQERIADIANAGEAIFHNKPSGIDVALAIRGGVGLYSIDTGLESVACEPFALVVGLSGEPRSTAEQVARVLAAPDRDTHLPVLGQLATRGVAALASGDRAGLGSLMAQAHEHLAALGVSTALLDKMVRSAKHAGALGAKLTGAGGGGAVIALAPGRENEIQNAWRALGVDSFVCTAGARP